MFANQLFWKSKIRTVTFLLFLINIFVFALIYRFAFKPEDFLWPSDENTSSFTDYMYFSVTNASTTGFGDIVPRTRLCRIVVAIQQVFTVFIVSMLLIH